MRVDEDVRRGSVLDEDAEDALDVATLRGARVEFAIRERTRPALTEAVVALRVDDAVPVEACHVVAPPAHVAAALEDDGTEPALDQAERGEQPCGPRPDDH